jgi:curved DNA-binding protein CbpA
MTTRIADPYATLGVPRTATAAQLREAYRRLAKQFHPDQSRDAQATERMQRINQAWQMLSSPTARSRYDAQSAIPPATAYPHWTSAPRRARPPFTTERAWASGAPGSGMDYRTESEAGPLRWVLTVAAALIAAFVLTAILGGAFPVLWLLLFFAARVALRAGD